MERSKINKRTFSHVAMVLLAGVVFQGCTFINMGAGIQWDSRSQVLLSEDSQVKLRSIQTREFETTDRINIMRATVATMQDLSFSVGVLDENLGIVSGKKLIINSGVWSLLSNDPTYYLYKTDALIIFNRNFRSFGPFLYRRDLTRMTVTVRPKGKTRSLVRVSVQYDLQSIEDPEIYQKFFKILGQSLFLSSQLE
jgi:hypothetical protein